MKKVILTCDICKKNDNDNKLRIYDLTPMTTSFFKLINNNYKINHMCEVCWENKYSKLEKSSSMTEPKNPILMLPSDIFDKLEEIIR
jgi:hypothetical protein